MDVNGYIVNVDMPKIPDWDSEEEDEFEELAQLVLFPRAKKKFFYLSSYFEELNDKKFEERFQLSEFGSEIHL